MRHVWGELDTYRLHPDHRLVALATDAGLADLDLALEVTGEAAGSTLQALLLQDTPDELAALAAVGRFGKVGLLQVVRPRLAARLLLHSHDLSCHDGRFGPE
jgi:hypothetical protein